MVTGSTPPSPATPLELVFAIRRRVAHCLRNDDDDEEQEEDDNDEDDKKDEEEDNDLDGQGVGV